MRLSHLALVYPMCPLVDGGWLTSCPRFTFPKTNIAPENWPCQKERIVFQPSIFRGENVSFREGTCFNKISLAFKKRIGFQGIQLRLVMSSMELASTRYAYSLPSLWAWAVSMWKELRWDFAEVFASVMATQCSILLHFFAPFCVTFINLQHHGIAHPGLFDIGNLYTTSS